MLGLKVSGSGIKEPWSNNKDDSAQNVLDNWGKERPFWEEVMRCNGASGREGGTQTGTR